MEIWIPSQTLDIHNIHMSPFQTQINQKVLIAPLKYIDTNITLNSLNILTPPLEVLFHDIQTGRLILSVADQPHFAIKMQMLQTYLASTLYMHQQSFFGFTNPFLTIEFFKKMLFPLVYNKKLTLFMGASAKTVSIYDKDGMVAATSTQTPQGIQRVLKPGESIRIALQLQGISILTNPALSILQTLREIPTQTDISGVINMCKIRFQQQMKAIYVIT